MKRVVKVMHPDRPDYVDGVHRETTRRIWNKHEKELKEAVGSPNCFVWLWEKFQKEIFGYFNSF